MMQQRASRKGPITLFYYRPHCPLNTGLDFCLPHGAGDVYWHLAPSVVSRTSDSPGATLLTNPGCAAKTGLKFAIQACFN